MKEEVKQLREEIAALEKEQINMKAQRKTVNLKVERTVNPFEAADNVRYNRGKLRVMYAAYDSSKSKTTMTKKITRFTHYTGLHLT